MAEADRCCCCWRLNRVIEALKPTFSTNHPPNNKLGEEWMRSGGVDEWMSGGVDEWRRNG